MVLRGTKSLFQEKVKLQSYSEETEQKRIGIWQ